jgi:tetratricopeptide (TPR) repeat protein
MSKKKRQSRKRRASGKTLAEIPFRELVEKDKELRELRTEYAGLPAEERRKAAEWALDSSQASMLLARALNEPDLVHPAWHDAAAPLAIDPEYAPAMLTVGSLEYQFGRVEEAMELFLKLTTLPAHTEDLPEIIDKAGDFLIDQEDHVNAGRLYAAAVRAHPQVALHHVGLGYCSAEAGRKEESVAHHRRADELEPNNYLHLNDLGYALLEAGQYDEAEEVLRRAVDLAPPDYELARGNLEHLRKVRSGDLSAEEG